MANNTSPHILNTSANLLGFCLFVITSLHIANQATVSKIDEITSVIALFLGFACLFSFISIRTNNIQLERRYEQIADIIFMIALVGILGIIFLITWHFI